MKEEKKNLSDVLKNLQKEYGEESIYIEDDTYEGVNVETIPTGSFSLDYLLGHGGLPRGRIIEIYGKESSGKTTMCLYLIGRVQKNGGKCAFIDVEHAYDKQHSEALGVNSKELIVAKPFTLEQTMDNIRELVQTDEIDLIVVDSIAAMTPKAEMESEEMLKEGPMAYQARLLTKALRILSPNLAKHKTTIIFINQVRDNVGVMYGPKETTPGGRAMKFFASIRLRVKQGEKFIGKNDEQVGNEIVIHAEKNKLAPPHRECTIGLFYNSGIDLASDLFEFGVKSEIITKSGNTYSFGDTKLGVGRDQSITALRDNSELYEKVQNGIEGALRR